jgi:hypothetical protein
MIVEFYTALIQKYIHVNLLRETELKIALIYHNTQINFLK